MSYTNTGYTGKIFEEEVIGHCEVSWDGRYIPFAAALRQVERSQPSKNRTANELLAQVRKHVPQVELYCAVGTALDRFHGIDGYFRFAGIMVTFDISLNSKGQYKADLEFTQDDAENLGSFAGRVAEMFTEKSAHRKFLETYNKGGAAYGIR